MIGDFTMSIQYTVIEKITVKDSKKLPAEVLETIAKEASRINAFRQSYDFSCEVMMNTGDGWKEYDGEKFSDDTIRSVLQNSRNLAIFIRCTGWVLPTSSRTRSSRSKPGRRGISIPGILTAPARLQHRCGRQEPRSGSWSAI